MLILFLHVLELEGILSESVQVARFPGQQLTAKEAGSFIAGRVQLLEDFFPEMKASSLKLSSVNCHPFVQLQSFSPSDN